MGGSGGGRLNIDWRGDDNNVNTTFLWSSFLDSHSVLGVTTPTKFDLTESVVFSRGGWAPLGLGGEDDVTMFH